MTKFNCSKCKRSSHLFRSLWRHAKKIKAIDETMLTMLTMLTHFWHTAEKNIAWSRFWCIWSRFVFELVKWLQEVTLERWTQQITQINFKHQHINCTNLKWNDYRHKFNLWKRHFLWFFPSCCISQGCRKGVAKVIFFHHCDFKSVPMLYRVGQLQVQLHQSNP